MSKDSLIIEYLETKREMNSISPKLSLYKTLQKRLEEVQTRMAAKGIQPPVKEANKSFPQKSGK